MATIPNMFELIAPASRKPIPFAGSDFNAERDQERLTRQIDCILSVVLNTGWWTVQGITEACRKRFPRQHFPENSVQAQLRNLRKIGYAVEKRNVAESGVLFQYHVTRQEVAVA